MEKGSDTPVDVPNSTLSRLTQDHKYVRHGFHIGSLDSFREVALSTY